MVNDSVTVTSDTATDQTNRTKQRRPKGSAPVAERLHRAEAAVRGIAADVLQRNDATLTAQYSAALTALEALGVAFETPAGE